MNETGSGGLSDLLVLKIGGAAGLPLVAIAQDVARLARPLVVVHGVSGRMKQLAEERGLPERMLVSPSGHHYRHTDEATRALLVEAAAQVNEEIVEQLRTAGIPGESFVEPLALRAKRKRAIRAVVEGRPRIIRDDYSGVIQGVAVEGLRSTLAGGRVPVVPPLAASEDGPLNVDGDRAAAAIAVALKAEGLLILSNVRGLYRRYPEESSLVAKMSAARLAEASEWAQGRMKRKVLGAQEALTGGVRWVRIGDGRRERPIAAALAGEGTCFHA
ncbi:MAG: [LysW]-aminoadipate kinase [Anaerolineaceae bacterium]|nr:[LysW]-aminoadipate kinase [Anaerolineaceae bacterium]